MKRLLQLVVLLACAMLPLSLGRVGTGLNVQAWLSKPGVRLLAVEFYATWCKPCMEAVPKWDLLNKKYHDKGLRLVVVSVREEAGCVVPSWTPDATICDEEGTMQTLWKANPLPQAFLFSWQGNLLAAHANVEQVEAAIEKYFRETPRILVDTPTDDKGKALANANDIKKMVRSELKRGSKFDLVADANEIDEIRKLRKKFDNPNYEEKQQCKLGEDVSANSQLKVTIKPVAGGKSIIRLELFSLERGCLVAAAKATLGGDMESAVSEAAATLLQQLIDVGEYRGEGQGFSLAETPKTGNTTTKGGKSGSGESVSFVPSEGEEVTVTLESDPAGMKVFYKGMKACDATPCNIEVTSGSSVFDFKSKDGRYEQLSMKVDVRPGMQPVRAVMKATFASIDVTSVPTGMEVHLDGTQIGLTPLIGREIKEGNHRIGVGGGDVYIQQWKDFRVGRGEKKTLLFELKARQGSLKVSAKKKEGDLVEGKVTINGVEMGTTGKTFAVNVGKHIVTVSTDFGQGQKEVAIAEGKTETLTIEVAKVGLMGLTWIKSKVVPLEFTKSEVTVAQYMACQKAGGCPKKNYYTYERHEWCNYGYEDRGSYPMNCINYEGVTDFCKWVDGRLPTQQEWYAEASDNGKREHPWGNEKPTCEYAVIFDASGRGCGKNSTWPVCSKEKGKSVSGLCDMVGNVWEWTMTPYGNSTDKMVTVGGDFYLEDKVWHHNNSKASLFCELKHSDTSNGFRCVKPAK